MDYVALLRNAAFFVVPVAIGLQGATITKPAIKSWYKRINKAPWNPPNWVFGPVWTTLYLLMGTASYLVYQQIEAKPEEVKHALIVYAVSLALNWLWTPIFFGLGWFKASAAEMVLLWANVLLTITLYQPINQTAAYLLYPYIAWLTLAFTLNVYIAIFNWNGPPRDRKD